MRGMDSGYSGQLGEKRATRGRGQHSVILKNVGVNPVGVEGPESSVEGAGGKRFTIFDLRPPSSEIRSPISDLLSPNFYLLAPVHAGKMSLGP